MTKLTGVKALRSPRTGGIVLASFGPSALLPYTPPQEVLDAIPLVSLERVRVPAFPRIPPDAGDAEVVRLMAQGWCLAHHALTGARRLVQPSRWSPGTRTTLTQAGRLLGQSGASPAMYAAHRWRALVDWQGIPPKGPTAVFGVRWIQPSADAVLAEQRRAERQLIPLGPAGQRLSRLRRDLDQAIAREHPSSAEQVGPILEGLAPDWRDLLDRAITEQAMAVQELEQRIARGEWVWR